MFFLNWCVFKWLNPLRILIELMSELIGFSVLRAHSLCIPHFFLYPLNTFCPFEMFMHFVWPKCWVHDDAVVPCFVFRIIRVLTRKWMELLTHGQSHLFSDLSEIGYLTQCVVDYWTQYWNIKLFSLICVLCAVNLVSLFFQMVIDSYIIEFNSSLFLLLKFFPNILHKKIAMNTSFNVKAMNWFMKSI